MPCLSWEHVEQVGCPHDDSHARDVSEERAIRELHASIASVDDSAVVGATVGKRGRYNVDPNCGWRVPIKKQCPSKLRGVTRKARRRYTTHERDEQKRCELVSEGSVSFGGSPHVHQFGMN